MDPGRTKDVAALRETETSPLEVKINKLEIAIWGVGNGVEI